MIGHYVESDAGRMPVRLVVDTDWTGWVEIEASNERDYAQVTLRRDDVKRLHAQLGSWLNGEAL